MSLQFLADQPHWVQASAGLAVMALLAFSARGLAHLILMRGFGRLAESAPSRVTRVVLHREVLARLAQVLPSLVVQLTVGLVPFLPETAATVIRNVAVAVTVLHVVRVLMALLDAVQAEHTRSGANGGPPVRSIKSHVQLAKLAMMFLGGIVMIAALIDRSPLILLSGLGAMSAVLMLVFKDTLLSFTAGLQLASNDMLRVGDWIEMPQVGADGFVIDIALHTVKVQNWDKTITTIPTWRLMSDSYKNWRGMFESGGRRIRRSLHIDAHTIRLLTAEQRQKLSMLEPLKDYWSSDGGLRMADAPAGSEMAAQHLSNLAAFKAYAYAYLLRHPHIHKTPNMFLLVRTMEPSPMGVPLELFCYTSTTVWVEYEAIQGAIFDHLIGMLPLFGLSLYQRSSDHGQHLRLAGNERWPEGQDEMCGRRPGGA